MCEHDRKDMTIVRVKLELRVEVELDEQQKDQ